MNAHTFLKVVGITGLVGACVLVLAASMAYAMPDYEVEASYFASGESCRKVTYQGKPVKNGCQKVKSGEITRYALYYVK